MSNQNVGLARRTLIAAIKAAPAFTNITVDYAYSGKSAGASRTYVYGGFTHAQQKYAAMTSGTKPRDRTFTVDIHIEVHIPGAVVQDTEDAALVLLDAIDALIAADVTLGGGVPGLRWVGVDSFDVTYALGDDDTPETAIIAHVAFSTRLF